MDIRFNCPRCGQHLSVEQRGAGMTVNCPSCKGRIEVPSGTPPPAPPLSPTAVSVVATLPKVPTSATPTPKQGALRFMETFTPVFIAIIAAVVAIIGVFFLIRPFLQYNEAKRLCLAEIDSALAYGRDLSGGLDAQLGQLNSSQRRIIRAEQTLISVLAHKPLSLPLTSKERKLLSEAKSAIRRDTLSRLKNAFEIYKATYGNYPRGTPTEILKALQSDNPHHVDLIHADRTQLNQNGELVDPDGKPYPLEISQIEALLAQ
jgi:DNA-directed RNA polymerase subunit RPC12/RpoP